VEFKQSGISGEQHESLAPGKAAVFSWVDPEQAKGKRLLKCHLNIQSESDQLLTFQKLEIDFDNAEYSQTFVAKFANESKAIGAGLAKARRQTYGAKKKPPLGESQALASAADPGERAVKIEVLPEGHTKTLRLTETLVKGKLPLPTVEALEENEARQLLPDPEPGSALSPALTSLKPRARAETERLKAENRLEPIEDPDVLYEVEETKEEEKKTF
jgi:hypothetical protein